MLCIRKAAHERGIEHRAALQGIMHEMLIKRPLSILNRLDFENQTMIAERPADLSVNE